MFGRLILEINQTSLIWETILKKEATFRKAYDGFYIQKIAAYTLEDRERLLSDAGLMGRLVMSQQGRWPKTNTDVELKHKLGECIWWLTVLADRMEMDINEATEYFLDKTEKMMG